MTRYLELAKKYDLNVTTMATAWSMQHDFVASTIIGATTAAQLDDTFAALDVRLSEPLMSELAQVQKDILYPMG